MRIRLRSVGHQVGRRGAFLLFLAFLDTIFGYFILYPPPEEIAQKYPFWPPWAWGAAWLAVAAACLLGAFLRRDRIPYTMASLIKTAWGLRYAWLWFTGSAPFAWVSTTLWLCFSAIVLVVASWPEVSEVPVIYVPLPPHDGGDDEPRPGN